MKKSIAMCLCLILMVCGLPFAQATEVQSGMEGSQLQAQGIDSFGSMLAEKINTQTQSQQENQGNNIFSVTVDRENLIATVSFETTCNATLVVALYDGDFTELLRSGYTGVTPQMREVQVTVQTTVLPVYFGVKVFLVESESLAPLCPALECTTYTYEGQTFLNKTTADFEDSEILNFDEDSTNNFAVYHEGVVVATEETDGRLIAENSTQTEYTFSDCSSKVTGLQKGDCFAFRKTDGMMILLKVANVTINGTQVTLQGEDAEFETFFSYIKIDARQGAGQAEYDPALCGEGVTYKGKQSGSDPLAAKGFTEDYQDELSLSFDLDYAKFLTGNLHFKCGFTFKYFYEKDYEYCELKFDYKFGVTFELAKKGEKDFSLGYVAFAPMPGLYISITPSFTIKGDVKAEISGEIVGTVGSSKSSDTGEKDLTSLPKCQAGFKGEANVFFGFTLNPKLAVMSDKFAKLEMDAYIGIKIVGKWEISTQEKDYKHECKQCLDGDVFGVVGFEISAQMFNNEKFKWVVKGEMEEKFLDFYWSLDYNEFAFTECPHIAYKVTFSVTDESKNPLEGATVTYAETLVGTTDANGKWVAYLPNGHYVAKGEWETKQGKFRFTVKKEAKDVPLTLRDYGTGATMVSAGGCHSAAISEDGDLYLWGSDAYGQLGNGAGEKVWQIPQVLMHNVAYVDLGPHCTGAIGDDGSLYTWGWNINGQLGTGDTTSSSTPVYIMGGVKQIAFGDNHAAAVTNSGDLYTWGGNGVGQCGDGKSNTYHYTPKYIMGGVESVALGTNHTLIVTTGGELYATGGNSNGQLGTGDTKSVKTPVKIMDNVIAAGAGDYFSAALTADGTLYTFGLGKLGRLGNGSDDVQKKPKPILSSVVKITVGTYGGGAITKNGALYMWGGNGYGQLGTGDYNDHRYSPYKTMDDVVDVEVAAQHTIAVTVSGDVYTMGDDRWGELGNGDKKGGSYVPQKIILPVDMEEAQDTVSQMLATQKTKTQEYSGLVPGRLYNFYVMGSPNGQNPFESTNLAYIAQGIADEKGNLKFEYVPRSIKGATEILLVEQFFDAIAYGDVNNDGNVNAKDALLVLRIAVNKYIPNETEKQRADVNRDANINAKDALEILKKAVGKPACF